MKTFALTSALLVAGSLGFAEAPAGTASATINDAMGKTIGTAALRETTSGVLIKVDFTAAPAGTHALHVHTTGKCDAPMFMTAGGHFAPGMTKHGLLAAGGPHAGDLPNIYRSARAARAHDRQVRCADVHDRRRSLRPGDDEARTARGRRSARWRPAQHLPICTRCTCTRPASAMRRCS